MIPLSYDAERAVIGAVFTDSTLFSELPLKSDYFLDKAYKLVYQAFEELTEREVPIDFVSVAHVLSSKGQFESSGGYELFWNASEKVPTSENVKQYAEFIFNDWEVDKIQKASSAVLNKPTASNIDYLEQILINRKGTLESNDKGDTTEAALEIIDSLHNETPMGISTYHHLDRLTGGLRGGQLIILGARPSVGKSAFITNLSVDLGLKEVNIDFYSLEMRQKSVLQRAVTNLSQLDAAKWFQPNVRFSESEKGEVINNLGIFSQLNINVYDDASISCQQIILNTRKRRKELGGTNNLVVMIDYLQLMEGGAAETNTLRIGKITRDLKKLAMECDVPIILLSQLSRGVESRQDKRPIQSDLRDSGNIEQDADVILFLHRDDYYNRDEEDQDNITEVIVAKARDGSTGSVKFLFVKEYMKFTELTYQEQV